MKLNSILGINIEAQKKKFLVSNELCKKCLKTVMDFSLTEEKLKETKLSIICNFFNTSSEFKAGRESRAVEANWNSHNYTLQYGMPPLFKVRKNIPQLKWGINSQLSDSDQRNTFSQADSDNGDSGAESSSLLISSHSEDNSFHSFIRSTGPFMAHSGSEDEALNFIQENKKDQDYLNLKKETVVQDMIT